MLEFARKLCQGVSGSQCSAPAFSSWSLVAPTQTNIGADVVDIATGGIAVAIPANGKVYGSYFETGVAQKGASGTRSLKVGGYGAGAGAGIGWGIPFAGARVTGKLPDGLKKKIIESIGGAAQGKIVDLLKDATMNSVAGGTRLVAGPDASGGDLTSNDFQNAWCTIFALGLNFSINGVSGGIVIFSKNRPVLQTQDLIHVRAIGLMGGVGLSTSIDVEGSGMVYRVSIL